MVTTTDYAGSYIYENSSLKFVNHTEGYIEPNGAGGYDYVYQYKDHLGNIRLSYSDSNDDGMVDNSEIMSEKNYYPFGLTHRGYNNQFQSTYYPYGFGGKEENDELELKWLDFGARNYDAALGRWMNLDPLAEQMRRHSPYNYAFDNPLRFIDPDGMSPNDIVIQGDEEFRQKALEDLQALTTETLEIDENGTVTISGCGGTDTCSEGTDLVSDLINSDKVVTIIETKGALSTSPKGNSSKGNIKEDGTLGEGTDAVVRYNPNVRKSGVDENGSTDRDPYIGLGHELDHARDFTEGTRDKSKTDPPIKDPDGSGKVLTKSELKTRKFENQLRKERNLPLRKTGEKEQN